MKWKLNITAFMWEADSCCRMKIVVTREWCFKKGGFHTPHPHLANYQKSPPLLGLKLFLQCEPILLTWQGSPGSSKCPDSIFPFNKENCKVKRATFCQKKRWDFFWTKDDCKVLVDIHNKRFPFFLFFQKNLSRIPIHHQHLRALSRISEI